MPKHITAARQNSDQMCTHKVNSSHTAHTHTPPPLPPPERRWQFSIEKQHFVSKAVKKTSKDISNPFIAKKKTKRHTIHRWLSLVTRAEQGSQDAGQL